jgi:MFS transporter, DHA1 family, inner membrane transport protein
MRGQLFALSLGAFAIGVTEFSPMGLLPAIADEIGVDLPAAGMLISSYALGVMVGAPVITYLLSPMRRRTALIGLMAVYTVGNLLSGIAPNYGLLLVARVVTSLAHGAFFGIGALVASDLVPREHRASAVATMFMGLTIANIGGVPAATWIGTEVGWRPAFVGISLLGIVTAVALAKQLPAGQTGVRPPIGAEMRVLVRRLVLQALLTTVLAAGSMFTLYTYIAAVLQRVTHATPGFVTAMLIVTGIGFTAGNAVSGRLARHSLTKTLLGFLSTLAIVSLLFPFLAATHLGAAIALFLWGAATFGVAAPVQTRVMQVAHDAPALASSVNIGAFNLGNALGAAFGGAILKVGLGYEWIAPAGGMLAIFAILLVLRQEHVSLTSLVESVRDIPREPS